MKTEQIKHRAALGDRVLPLLFGAHRSLGDRVNTVRALPSPAFALAAAVGALCRDGDFEEAANLFLDAVPPSAFDEPTPFLGLTSALLYLRGEDRLAFRHRHRLEEFFEESLPYFLENAREFCGVGDADRAEVMAVLFLLGQKNASFAATSAALRQLSSLERLLEDRSTLSEYNAPQTLAAVLHALAALVNLLEDAPLRARVRKCESALWHAATQSYDRRAGILLGPYSRASKEDLWAKDTPMRLLWDTPMRLLWDTILGPRMPVRPFSGEEPAPALLALASLYTAEDYHCPAASVRHALERPTPYRTTLTAEIAATVERDPDLLPCRYPSGTVTLFSAFHDGFSLSTASRPFGDGADTHNFFACVKRPVVRTEKDLATLFATLSVNGVPGRGREFSFQGERTALIFYSPKPALERTVPPEVVITVTHPETSLLEMRIGPRPFRAGDEVPFTHAPICLSFGNVYGAIYPLFREFCAVRAEVREGALLLSVASREAGQAVTAEEQKAEGGGFAITFSGREEAGSFEEFCRHAEEYTLKDEWDETSEERRISFSAGGEHLECALCPHTESIRYLRANGKSLI